MAESNHPPWQAVLAGIVIGAVGVGLASWYQSLDPPEPETQTRAVALASSQRERALQRQEDSYWYRVLALKDGPPSLGVITDHGPGPNGWVVFVCPGKPNRVQIHPCEEGGLGWHGGRMPTPAEERAWLDELARQELRIRQDWAAKGESGPIRALPAR
jgi:hypothetical protein